MVHSSPLEERVTPALRITSVDCDRERYRDLLLLADEQWDMVELYPVSYTHLTLPTT